MDKRPVGRNGPRQANGGRPLPEALAAELAPEIRQALMHWMRRRILRSLRRRGEPQTAEELLLLFPGEPASRVAYHALVLEHHGLTQSSYVERPGGQRTRGYTARCGERDEVALALDATERLDQPGS